MKPWRDALFASTLFGTAVRTVGRAYYRLPVLSPLANVPLEFGHEGQIGFLAVGRQGYGNQWAADVTQRLLLDDLGPLMRELHIDLVLSGADRFQQVLDVPGDPLHVSTNGGGEKLELELPEQASDTTFMAVRPGFASVTVERRSLEVAMLDRYGNVTYRKARSR